MPRLALKLPSALVADLPAPVRAALWMVAASSAFAAMIILIRQLTATFDPLQVVFFRNVFGLIAMLPWLAGHGLGALRTQRLGLHALRATIGIVSMICWFTALSLMPLAEATALSFTAPIFASVLAVIFLGEVMRLRRWSATAVGLLGTLVILRPDGSSIEAAAMLALASAVLGAASPIFVKIMARTESTGAIVTYMVLFLTPLSLVPALLVWQQPSLVELGFAALLGLAGTLGHLCLTRALATADATRGGAVRLSAPARGGAHGLAGVRRGAGDLDLDRRRDHRRQQHLHDAARDEAEAPRWKALWWARLRRARRHPTACRGRRKPEDRQRQAAAPTRDLRPGRQGRGALAPLEYFACRWRCCTASCCSPSCELLVGACLGGARSS